VHHVGILYDRFNNALMKMKSQTNDFLYNEVKLISD